LDETFDVGGDTGTVVEKYGRTQGFTENMED
jgi:hypothetical protein